MYTFLVVLHVIVSVLLVFIVLLQPGKGSGMGATFGGGSQAMFGGRGPTTFLHKLTTAMAVLFLILSIALTSLSSRPQSSLADEEDAPAPAAAAQPSEAAPAAAPAPAPAAQPADAAAPSAPAAPAAPQPTTP